MRRSPLACYLLLLPLAACGRSGQGTSISINSSDGNGTMVASADGDSGDVSLSLPGFQTKMQLPKLALGGQNFDMNGVRLYPGSSVSAMNVDAHGKDAVVHIGFTSPARPQTVRDWFVHQMQAQHFTVRPSGDGLAGKTDDGKRFVLHLRPDGPDRADGQIVLGG